MKILVINAGSSSLKYQFIDIDSEKVLAKGLCERIGIEGSVLTQKVNGKENLVEHNSFIFKPLSPYHRKRIAAECRRRRVYNGARPFMPTPGVDMLLAIDMGNTQTAMGLFDGDELVQSWRMPTDRSYTADEIHVRLMGFFKMYGLSLDAVDAIAFAGVVPQLSREWHAVADRIAADAIVIGPQTAAVTKLRAARPQAVGADRVANAVAAETFYGAPAIVVDFGTATNIDVIDEDGYYIGGAIAPGIRISMDALAARAAKLASVPLEAPEHAIGRDTEECIKVGAVVGAAAMAEGLVTRMKRELGREDATVIATGGLAGIVADSTDTFDVVDGQLTIKGICEIYRRMQKLG